MSTPNHVACGVVSYYHVMSYREPRRASAPERLYNERDQYSSMSNVKATGARPTRAHLGEVARSAGARAHTAYVRSAGGARDRGFSSSSSSEDMESESSE